MTKYDLDAVSYLWNNTSLLFYLLGVGNTTVSRLLFRFYDVLEGAVKVNGVDVRSISQKSLRGGIGVVPQAASMFNGFLWCFLFICSTNKDYKSSHKSTLRYDLVFANQTKNRYNSMPFERPVLCV